MLKRRSGKVTRAARQKWLLAYLASARSAARARRALPARPPVYGCSNPAGA